MVHKKDLMAVARQALDLTLKLSCLLPPNVEEDIVDETKDHPLRIALQFSGIYHPQSLAGVILPLCLMDHCQDEFLAPLFSAMAMVTATQCGNCVWLAHVFIFFFYSLLSQHQDVDTVCCHTARFPSEKTHVYVIVETKDFEFFVDPWMIQKREGGFVRGLLQEDFAELLGAGDFLKLHTQFQNHDLQQSYPFKSAWFDVEAVLCFLETQALEFHLELSKKLILKIEALAEASHASQIVFQYGIHQKTTILEKQNLPYLPVEIFSELRSAMLQFIENAIAGSQYKEQPKKQ